MRAVLHAAFALHASKNVCALSIAARYPFPGILPSGEPFAVDYYLGSHEQCNYASGANKGVCPDAGLLGVPPGSPAANNVKLLAAKKEGGVISVTFSRPAAASDRWARGAGRQWVEGAAGLANPVTQNCAVFNACRSGLVAWQLCISQLAPSRLSDG
jgi:hypothetical protein